MNVKKIAVAAVSGLVLGGIPLTSGTLVVSADNVSDLTEQADQQVLSEHVQDIADKYIHFNGTVFVLSDDAKNELLGLEFEQVQEQVKRTNVQITAITEEDLDTAIVKVADPNGEETNLDDRPQLAAYGKNAVTYHWNYARVYINKGTLNSMGVGVTIAGLWIPKFVAGAAVGTLGVLMGSARHGIVFDYNYWAPQWSIWKARWQ